MEVIYFHRDIKSFIDSFDTRTKTEISSTINLLSTEGHTLRMPFSKKVEKDIYELRILNPKNIRIFYTFYTEKIILLSVIHKKSQKLELHDLKTARRRLKLLQD